jgi:hypothetical protein
MKLEPKAKPIRIRIKLGNSEHSSLDSVKSNFSIKELYPLFKDGRLERWLEQIGEKQFAHRTGELSKQCGDGNMKDYIQFLSLFFKEVEDSLSAFKGEEWSIYDYLSSASLDTIQIIYAQTMDMEEIDWGEEFAKLVTNEEKYKELFTYLESFSRNNPQPERYKKIISTFYSNCSQKGYQWASAFKDEELTIDDIAYIYQNDCFQIPDVDWGKLFADCVKDWATDSERIEKIIKSEHNISFYNHCVKNGFEEAKMKLDPWYELANSNEYEIIIKALSQWLRSKNHNFNRDNHNYNDLNSPLGKQILDFLQSLKDLEYASWVNNNHSYGSAYYLEYEKQVMICVSKRMGRNGTGRYFNSDQKENLKAIQGMKEGDVELAVKLAHYADDNYTKEYIEIAEYAIEQIKEKLSSKREK